MTSATAVTTDVQAVRAVIDEYADLMRAGDADGIVDLYTPDAAVMAGDIPTTVGADQLRALYRGALDAMAIDYTFDFDEVIVRGVTAVARTRTTGKSTVRATGDEIPGKNRELFVLQRQGDRWKIAQYMFQAMPEQP